MPKKGQFKANVSKRTLVQRKYNSKPAQKKNRAERNRARAKAIKAGRASKGDGKDVGHVRPLKKTGAKRASGTRMQSKSANRRAGGRSHGKGK